MFQPSLRRTDHLINIIDTHTEVLETLLEINYVPQMRDKYKNILIEDTLEYDIKNPGAALAYIKDRIDDLNKLFEQRLYDEYLVQEVAHAIEKAKILGADVSNVQKQYNDYLDQALPYKEICEAKYGRPSPMNNRECEYIEEQYSKRNK